MKTNLTEAQKLIYAMLTENTGKHFLDSGGAYGRNWERNQVKTIEDFDSEDEQTYQLNTWTDKDGKERYEIYRTVSVFHYLSQLHLDEICEEFNTMPCENWDGDFYGTSENQSDFINDNFETEGHEFNTYNGESDLSQILQGCWLKHLDTEEHYLLLQIHGGCDARGGYTNAKLFYVGYEQIIHEYLREYMDSYELNEELEYIDEMTDYFDSSKVYEGKELDIIKTKLMEG